LQNLVVWAADIGSVAKHRFGWCRAASINNSISGTTITDLTSGVILDLTTGNKVALGFECPLFVPVSDDPIKLTKAREGEGSRSWSAGAGCGALATGLTECVWIFERICESEVIVRPTFNWQQFIEGDSNLFVWEAFVSGKSKGDSDENDAVIAAKSFCGRYPDIISDVTAENPYSLVGAALLRSGLTKDIKMLFQQCIVLRS